MAKEITILQQRFVDILFSMPEPNQEQAYIQAGYKSQGAAARYNASRMITNDNVQAYLQKLRDAATKLAVIDGAKVISELGKLGFSNIQDFVDIDKDGNVNFISFDSIGREKLAAVESIKVRTNITKNKDGSREYEATTTEFKLCSKEGALDKLGKHFGIYEKDNAQKAQTIFDILAIVGINVNGH